MEIRDLAINTQSGVKVPKEIFVRLADRQAQQAKGSGRGQHPPHTACFLFSGKMPLMRGQRAGWGRGKAQALGEGLLSTPF